MRVRFNEKFYHPTYGLFAKGEVYDVPDDVKLPKLGVTIIDGKKEKLEEGETPQQTPTPKPTKAELRRTAPKPVSSK